MENIDVSKITLTKKQLTQLKIVRRKGQLEIPKSEALLAGTWLVHVSLPENKDNSRIVYKPNENTEKYFTYLRERFLDRKLPIIISVIALIKACDTECLWLLQKVVSLTKTIMGI